jgi:hypothetical protein
MPTLGHLQRLVIESFQKISRISTFNRQPLVSATEETNRPAHQTQKRAKAPSILKGSVIKFIEFKPSEDQTPVILGHKHFLYRKTALTRLLARRSCLLKYQALQPFNAVFAIAARFLAFIELISGLKWRPKSTS